MKSTADMILIDSFTTSRVCLTMERKRSFSITYSPSCDLASLKSLKNVMMDQNNFPRSSFQTVMASYKVNLLFGLVSVQPPCTETYNPPTIQNPIPTITIPICNGAGVLYTQYQRCKVNRSRVKVGYNLILRQERYQCSQWCSPKQQ